MQTLFEPGLSLIDLIEDEIDSSINTNPDPILEVLPRRVFVMKVHQQSKTWAFKSVKVVQISVPKSRKWS